MDEELNQKIDERIAKLVPEYLKGEAFTDRKITDTPTDALQVVNKKYVDGLATSSVYGRMYLNSSQVITVSSPTFEKVLFDTANFAIGITADTTNHRLTASIAGYYQVNGAVQYIVPTTGEICAASIYKNGSEISRSWANVSKTNGNVTAVVNDVVSLNASDYVEIYTTKTFATGTLDNLSKSTYLSITKV